MTDYGASNCVADGTHKIEERFASSSPQYATAPVKKNLLNILVKSWNLLLFFKVFLKGLPDFVHFLSDKGQILRCDQIRARNNELVNLNKLITFLQTLWLSV